MSEFVLRFVGDLSGLRLATGSKTFCEKVQATFATSSILPAAEIVSLESHKTLENQ